MRLLGYEIEKSVEFGESSPSSWRLQEFAALQVCVGGKGSKNQRTQSAVSMPTLIFICISHSCLGFQWKWFLVGLPLFHEGLEDLLRPEAAEGSHSSTLLLHEGWRELLQAGVN